jgi:excisionase family DNA binding protein
MTNEKLLTLREAAEVLRLRTAETFSRFAQRHKIPLVRIGRRVVRVRRVDLETAIRDHREQIEGGRHG